MQQKVASCCLACLDCPLYATPRQVRCAIRLVTVEEVRQLAGMGIACSYVQLPPVEAPAASSPGRPLSLRQLATDLLTQFYTRPTAAARLLTSLCFVRHSSSCLEGLANCPASAAAAAARAGVLQRCAALSMLSLKEFHTPIFLLRPGGYLDQALDGCPPSLRELEITLPDLLLSHECYNLPAHLQRLILTVSKYRGFGHGMHLSPCDCGTCTSGFWGTVQTLHLSSSLRWQSQQVVLCCESRVGRWAAQAAPPIQHAGLAGAPAASHAQLHQPGADLPNRGAVLQQRRRTCRSGRPAGVPGCVPLPAPPGLAAGYPHTAVGAETGSL